MTQYETLAAGILATLGILGIILRVIRPVVRGWLRFQRDWEGTPERPGVPRVPGVVEKIKNLDDGQLDIIRRLSTVEREVLPNHGQSIADKVTRIDRAVGGGGGQ